MIEELNKATDRLVLVRKDAASNVSGSNCTYRYSYFQVVVLWYGISDTPANVTLFVFSVTARYLHVGERCCRNHINLVAPTGNRN